MRAILYNEKYILDFRRSLRPSFFTEYDLNNTQTVIYRKYSRYIANAYYLVESIPSDYLSLSFVSVCVRYHH